MLASSTKNACHSTHLGRDQDDTNWVLGIRKIADGLIPIKLGHSPGVRVALDALRLKMILHKVDKANELRKDDDLVRVVDSEPLVD